MRIPHCARAWSWMTSARSSVFWAHHILQVASRWRICFFIPTSLPLLTPPHCKSSAYTPLSAVTQTAPQTSALTAYLPSNVRIVSLLALTYSRSCDRISGSDCAGYHDPEQHYMWALLRSKDYAVVILWCSLRRFHGVSLYEWNIPG